MQKVVFWSAALSLCTALSSAQAAEVKLTEAANTALKVSVYNQDLAFVRDVRKVSLPAGNVVLAFEGVAQQMQPNTAMVEAAGTKVLEKNYEYDLLDYTNLLNKYIGKEVKTVMTNPANGANIFDKAVVLNAAYGSPLLKFSYGVEGNFPGRVVFDELPDSLRTKPTLVAKLDSAEQGDKEVQLSYLTQGLSWKADYVAELTGDEQMNIQGFVTLNNQSGADYKNAEVQLISGNVEVPQTNQIQPRMMLLAAKAANYESAADSADAGNIAPLSLGEYYVYTLPFKTDILDKQSKQVSFVSLNELKYQSIYRLSSPLNVTYVGSKNSFEHLNPSLYYKIVNAQEANLPQGDIRFFAQGQGADLQFVGGTALPQLAKGEDAELAVGKAGDIYVEGQMTATRQIAEKTLENDYKIVFANTKKQPVTVEFEQNVYGSVMVVKASQPAQENKAGELKWAVEVPAEGNLELTYTLRVTKN